MAGSLIYLTLTQPDMSFAVGVLSRFMQNPGKPHIGVPSRVLRYIKAILNYSLQFMREPYCKLIAFCNADYAGDLNTRSSTAGYVFMLGSNIISWTKKHQLTVSLSTTEA
ncbi:secreted RxLR effector protein 161-like [Lactuca sativa]|uniref:secreted RxLR effector protein 161-like n=1 Tax=Lactuca sativa TaxID=4236 RepID=UPI000CD8F0AF|nr:secreted RxLR effector protein 161-like [Lactuca sativa]